MKKFLKNLNLKQKAGKKMSNFDKYSRLLECMKDYCVFISDKARNDEYTDEDWEEISSRIWEIPTDYIREFKNKIKWERVVRWEKVSQAVKNEFFKDIEKAYLSDKWLHQTLIAYRNGYYAAPTIDDEIRRILR